MKKYILLKPSPSIQLAHLYEHIFCMQLNKFLLSKKMYLNVDYDFIAKTYHGGIVYFEFSQYTNMRLNIRKILLNLDIGFNSDMLDLGISQLTAERLEHFGHNGYQNILDELNLLHGQAWSSLDDFKILDARSIRRKSYPIYIADGARIRPKRLYLNIIFKNDTTHDEHHLVPLFRQIGHLIMVNLENTICDKYGYFSECDSFKNEKNISKLTNTLRVGLANVDLSGGLTNITQNLVKSMTNDGVFKRSISQLRSLSYEKRPSEVINFEHNYENTLIFIGSKGWKSIATPGNIDMILNNSMFEFGYGKEKITFPIK